MLSRQRLPRLPQQQPVRHSDKQQQQAGVREFQPQAQSFTDPRQLGAGASDTPRARPVRDSLDSGRMR